MNLMSYPLVRKKYLQEPPAPITHQPITATALRSTHNKVPAAWLNYSGPTPFTSPHPTKFAYVVIDFVFAACLDGDLCEVHLLLCLPQYLLSLGCRVHLHAVRVSTTYSTA